ncbi:MAG: HalOD1 output domain-containing protein [Haloarculaceae archaeon]
MVESPDVYEPEPDETVSDAVARAVADSMEVDPAEMDVRLYDAIDPDALDRLFETPQEGVGRRLSFRIADRQVVVDESRRVHVTTHDGNDGGDCPGPLVLRGSASPWRLVFSKL